MLLVLAGLVFIFSPITTLAQDFDKDGILDDEEGQCFPLDASNCAITSERVPDLFVIRLIDPMNSVSLLPSEPFEFITRPGNPFSILLHEISVIDAPTQEITPTQNAIALIEDLRTSDGDLGTSQIGTPFDRISGRVFSFRIREDVRNACNLQLPQNCEAADSYGNIYRGVDEIFNFYARNVVAHETFHMLNRVVPPDRKVDYHYPQLGDIMDHHMYYKVYKKTKKVVWYISDKWTDADLPQYK